MRKTRTMKINDIKIKRDFEKHFPRAEKLFNKLWYYTLFNRFCDEIIINSDGVLIDGYTTYILACMLGKRKIKVRYKED